MKRITAKVDLVVPDELTDQRIVHLLEMILSVGIADACKTADDPDIESEEADDARGFTVEKVEM